MKPSRVVVFWKMALAFLFVTNVANSQPTYWADVMYALNDWNAASGNYFPLGSGSAVYETDLRHFNPANPYELSLQGVVLPTTGTYSWMCGKNKQLPGTSLSSTAVTFLETYKGGGIKGVGFYGAFTNQNPFGLTVGDNPVNVIQSVFFNENQCYRENGVGENDGPNANGREYGFTLYSLPQNGSNIYAYWGTMENQGPNGSTIAQVNFPMNSLTNQVPPENGGETPIAGQEYYYELYPVAESGTCAFTINVFNTGYALIYSATNIPVDGNSASAPWSTAIGPMQEDSQFCNVIAAPGGDIGFVSANVNPPSNANGILPERSAFNLKIQRLLRREILCRRVGDCEAPR